MLLRNLLMSVMSIIHTIFEFRSVLFQTLQALLIVLNCITKRVLTTSLWFPITLFYIQRSKISSYNDVSHSHEEAKFITVKTIILESLHFSRIFPLCKLIQKSGTRIPLKGLEVRVSRWPLPFWITLKSIVYSVVVVLQWLCSYAPNSEWN